MVIQLSMALIQSAAQHRAATDSPQPIILESLYDLPQLPHLDSREPRLEAELLTGFTPIEANREL